MDTSLATSKTWMLEPSLLNNVILPVPAWMFSLKVRMMSASKAMPVAPSAGLLEARPG